MTEKAAYTLRNDLHEVRELGIQIVSGENESTDFDGKELRIEEVNLGMLQGFLQEFDDPLFSIDIVAVAVQDHGLPPKGMSNRRFRIQKMKELLKDSSKPEALAFKEEEVPTYFLRMKSAALASKRQLPTAKVLIMDTSPAAIFGCLEDPVIEKDNPLLVVNVGNAHTMAAIISKGNIAGIMEHHTRLLDPQRIERLLVHFANGKLTDETVFNHGGHGMFFLTEPPGFSEIERVAATGPNRNILAKTSLPIHFATPAGDVMMTGPIGLVEATKRKFRME